jgi:type IV pilus assembly protein PilE
MRTSHRIRRDRSAGFTLIELMTAILVAAILGTIAVPMYTNQIQKSRRTEAKTALLDLAAREERFFSTNGAYTATAGSLGYSALPVGIGGNYYQLSVAIGVGGATFSGSATPQGVQTKDTACATFSLDNTGAQSVSGTATATPSTCWN